MFKTQVEPQAAGEWFHCQVLNILWHHFIVYLTNRRQFSMVYTLIDNKMMSQNVQNSSGTMSRRRVVSLPSFEHFVASFYCL